MSGKKSAVPIKETVLAAVIQFGRPVGLSELWDTHCKEWVKTVGGKTPKNTISRNLTTLCGEHRLERVAAPKKAYVPTKGQTCDDTGKGGAGDMYLYCAPGTCNAATVACNPIGAKKRAAAPIVAKKRAAAPIVAKKRAAVPKKVATKKAPAKRASAATAAATSSSAAAKEERGGGGEEGGDFGGGDFEPEDVEQDEPAAAATAFATAKTAPSAAASSRAVKTTKKRRQAKQAASGGKRRKTTVCQVVKKRESYINSIGKLFYQHKSTESYSISRKSACAIDAIVREQIDAIGNAAHGLLQRAKQSTFDSRTAQMAIGMCYRGDLAKLMNLEGKKALTHETRAGKTSQINIPAGRVKRQLKASRVASRYSANVDVFIASAINYFVEELIDESVLVLKASKHKRLLPRDIMLAVSNDEDFRAALRGTFGGGGVVPSK